MFEEYIKLRNELNPFQKPNFTIWDKYINMDMATFSETINKLPYRWDRLHGLVDKTDDIDTFFDKKEHNRDCDDFARAWQTWGVYNDFHTQEIIVTTKEHIATKAHVIAIIDKEDKFYLCNYKVYGAFKSFDKALDYMHRFPSYKDGFIFEKGIEK